MDRLGVRGGGRLFGYIHIYIWGGLGFSDVL